MRRMIVGVLKGPDTVRGYEALPEAIVMHVLIMAIASVCCALHSMLQTGNGME